MAVRRGRPRAFDREAALARFVQAVQSGMSILARDGATKEELVAVAETAMMAWDARTDVPPAPRAEAIPDTRLR